MRRRLSRRQLLTGSAAAGLVPAANVLRPTTNDAGPIHPSSFIPHPSHVAITLDLEMSRNFPRWEDTHWDYEKGNLNAETKAYAVEACRRVRERGGIVHCFALGRTMEQEDVGWLQGIARAGHPVGNHTYDHVNVRATRAEEIQFRFQRSPWLIEGKTPTEVIRENIRMAAAALRARLGIEVAGFRTPGGFADGLSDRPDIQKMLLELGFRWVSSLYPPHMTRHASLVTRHTFAAIAEAAVKAQPFVYPSGLVEVPMSPISDIGAFRNGRWTLEQFLQAIRAAVEAVIERGRVFDFLGHPSCLYVTDPKFRTVDLICNLVRQAGDRAVFADLGVLARGAQALS